MSSPSRRPSPRPRPEPPAASPASSQAASSRATSSQATSLHKTSPRETSSQAATSPEPQAAEPPRAPRRRPGAAILQGARDARAAQRERAAASRTEPRFDASSWLGALIVMTVFTAAVWVVQILNATHRNATHRYPFNRFGLVPRQSHGLWGVLAAPFLHASYRDMLADTLPVLLIGWVVLLAGLRIWLAVTAVVVVVGGALTWLIGPDHLGHEPTLILGSSGLVFGWIGYLVARAIFSRKIKWIVTAAMVLLVFGALLGQLVPVSHSQQAWQWHVASFVAGVGVGALLHPHRKSPRAERRRKTVSAVS